MRTATAMLLVVCATAAGLGNVTSSHPAGSLVEDGDVYLFLVNPQLNPLISVQGGSSCPGRQVCIVAAIWYGEQLAANSQLAYASEYGDIVVELTLADTHVRQSLLEPSQPLDVSLEGGYRFRERDGAWAALVVIFTSPATLQYTVEPPDALVSFTQKRESVYVARASEFRTLATAQVQAWAALTASTGLVLHQRPEEGMLGLFLADQPGVEGSLTVAGPDYRWGCLSDPIYFYTLLPTCKLRLHEGPGNWVFSVTPEVMLGNPLHLLWVDERFPQDDSTGRAG